MLHENDCVLDRDPHVVGENRMNPQLQTQSMKSELSGNTEIGTQNKSFTTLNRKTFK